MGATALGSLGASRRSVQTTPGETKGAKPLLMIPGPIEFSEGVLQSISLPTLSHVSPDFIEQFGQALEQLRSVFLTEKGQPFVLAGSGTLGWDMAACNLLQKGDKALVVNTGYFGDRFGECLTAYGADVTHARTDIGNCPSVADVTQLLGQRDSFKMVTLTHVDTSTGVLVDIKSFAQAIRKHSPNAIVVVDGVCASGGEELRMDEWDVDVVLTASQKAIGVPPGLAILMASQRAMSLFKSRTAPVANYFCDWSKWLPIMESYEGRKPAYFATPPVNLIRGLHTSLYEILSEGEGAMDKRFKAHQTAGKAVREAVKALNLTTVAVSDKLAANTITAVRFPQGVSGPALLPKVKAHGAELAGGLHQAIKAEYFRIGHMGVSVTDLNRGHLEQTIRAVEQGLVECGYTGFERGAPVKALQRVLTAQ